MPAAPANADTSHTTSVKERARLIRRVFTKTSALDQISTVATLLITSRIFVLCFGVGVDTPSRVLAASYTGP